MPKLTRAEWKAGFAGAFLLGFFLFFHRQVFQTDFGLDEMRNIYEVWVIPPWKIPAALLMFWSKTVRPMAAIYYLPLYGLFGLTAGPFTLMRNLLLLANTALFFKLAGSIGRSYWIALLATLPIAYQAHLGNLAYDGAFIYDVLCGTFYFAALLYYVRLRAGHKSTQDCLHPTQLGIFLALYVAALDSKEMAVSLPVLILAYEVLFKGRKARYLPAILAIAVTLIFIVGRIGGQGALSNVEGYRPVFEWTRFAESNTRFLNEIFYTSQFTFGRVLTLWTALLYLGLRNWGLRSWDPRWLYLLVWVLVTPLPLAFLAGRGGGTLYIPAAGWAILSALAARALVRRFSLHPVAGLSRRAIMRAGFLACFVLYTHETVRVDRQLQEWYLSTGRETRQVLEKLKALDVHPAPHSRVAFLNDPFPGAYYTFFMATVLWHDPTVQIELAKIAPLSEAELGRMDYIFDYVDGRFVAIKSAAR